MPITIHANDPVELAMLLGGIGFTRAAALTSETPIAPLPQAAAPPADEQPKPARTTRKKATTDGGPVLNGEVKTAAELKAEAEAQAQAQKEAAEKAAADAAQKQAPTQPKADAANPTLEDCRAALQKCYSAKSPEEAKAVLEKYGAKKVSELKPENYAAFVKDCG